jgi:DNA-binding PadR family transcriptional regulator
MYLTDPRRNTMFGKHHFEKYAERIAQSRCGNPGDRPEGRHGDREHRHFGRHGFGGFGGGGWEGFKGRGFGGAFGGGERLFDSGELRLVILNLVAEKPSYGYEIIKAIEERLSGGYTPSAGVVYPTLTLLEEEGYAVSSQEGAKKLYTVTESGLEFLKTNEGTIKAIFGRMEQASHAFGRGKSPQIMRAMMNLGFAIKMRATQGSMTADQINGIAAAIDAAAKTISEI